MNDLSFTQGQDNLAGIVGKIRIVPIEDVDTLPTLALATSLKITGNITLVALKAWSELYFTDETGKVAFKEIGERDGMGLETILTVRHPKLTTELFDWIRRAQNTPSLVAFKMANSGKWYIIGLTQLDITSTTVTADIPAYFESGEGGSGEKRSDQNGKIIGWKYSAAHGPIEYAGTFDLDTGT